MPNATSPTLSSTEAAIKIELQAVLTSNVSVYEYLRWGIEDKDVYDRYIDSSDRFHFYQFSRTSTEEFEDPARRRFFAIHEWTIHGYFVINDANNTHKTLQLEVENIKKRFRFNKNIFGIPERMEKSERTITMVKIDSVIFDEVLCWHAEFTLR